MSGASILIRCDASPSIGLGHLVRCLALAEILKYNYDVSIAFAMKNQPLGISMVEQHGYPVFVMDETDSDGDYGEWLSKAVASARASVLLLDVRDGLSLESVKTLKQQKILVVILDDSHERRLAADLVFYPPVPQIDQLDWTGFAGELLTGWDWIPLRSGFACKLSEPLNQLPQVVVTMGGSDPAALSLLALRALELLDSPPVVHLIIGRGFVHRQELALLLKKLRLQVILLEDVWNMPEVLAHADLAVASFGVTAYELAALGVPAILLSMTEDHARSALALHRTGMALSLGCYAKVSEGQLAGTIRELLADTQALRTMRAASSQVDGKGAQRIASKICEVLAAQNSGQKRSRE